MWLISEDPRSPFPSLQSPHLQSPGSMSFKAEALGNPVGENSASGEWFLNSLRCGASLCPICFKSISGFTVQDHSHLFLPQTVKLATSLLIQLCGTGYLTTASGILEGQIALQIPNAHAHFLYLSPDGLAANSSQLGCSLWTTTRVVVRDVALPNEPPFLHGTQSNL